MKRKLSLLNIMALSLVVILANLSAFGQAKDTIRSIEIGIETSYFQSQTEYSGLHSWYSGYNESSEKTYTPNILLSAYMPVFSKFSVKTGIGFDKVSTVVWNHSFISELPTSEFEVFQVWATQNDNSINTQERSLHNTYVVVPTVVEYSPWRMLNVKAGVNHRFLVDDDFLDFSKSKLNIYCPNAIFGVGFKPHKYLEISVERSMYLRYWGESNYTVGAYELDEGLIADWNDLENNVVKLRNKDEWRFTVAFRIPLNDVKEIFKRDKEQLEN